MSDSFASQLNAFKKSLKTSSITLPDQKRVIRQSSPTAKPSPLREALKRKKEEDELKENPIKRNKHGLKPLSLRLEEAIDVIKKYDRPVLISDLSSIMAESVDSALIKCLKIANTISYDPVKKTVEYVSIYKIKSEEDLMRTLKSQTTFSGLSVKELKDGWHTCTQTLNKLEKENKIIIYKTKKDNAARHVWLNLDGKIGDQVDYEFVDIWRKIRVPKGDDLIKLMIDNGLMPTNYDPEAIKKKTAPVQERKQKKARKGKVTNIHMKGILRDYSSRV
ncbi:hypothetical protein B5S28_g3188 [[Candida] boidinii]|nr:hypothetical protein B5S28_g3188 [[Candida] boidinii]